jgi:hypothetical protein
MTDPQATCGCKCCGGPDPCYHLLSHERLPGPSAKAREILQPHGDYFDEAEDYEACIDHIAAALEAYELGGGLVTTEKCEHLPPYGVDCPYCKIKLLESQLRAADEVIRHAKRNLGDRYHPFNEALAAYEKARG